MILVILFWILWLLWAIGCFFPLDGNIRTAHGALAMLLIGILGFKAFGNPLS